MRDKRESGVLGDRDDNLGSRDALLLAIQALLEPLRPFVLTPRGREWKSQCFIDARLVLERHERHVAQHERHLSPVLVSGYSRGLVLTAEDSPLHRSVESYKPVALSVGSQILPLGLSGSAPSGTSPSRTKIKVGKIIRQVALDPNGVKSMVTTENKFAHLIVRRVGGKSSAS